MLLVAYLKLSSASSITVIGSILEYNIDYNVALEAFETVFASKCAVHELKVSDRWQA